MDKAHPLSSPTIVRLLNVKNDSFRPCKNGEKLLGPKVLYLSVISALMYLAKCTYSNIAFSVHLLAMSSFILTNRHWNGIKLILISLQETIDMSLFYSNESKQQSFGYTAIS